MNPWISAGVVIALSAFMICVLVLLVGDGKSSIQSAEQDEYRGGDDV